MSIKNFIVYMFLFHSLSCQGWFFNRTPAAVIMLEAAGHSKYMGRVIEESFEQGLTLLCAYHVKQQIEQALPSVKVLVNRSAGEALDPLQNATFANRMKVNLYISINFFHETALKPHFYLYQFVETGNTAVLNPHACSFYPAHQAYLFNQGKSERVAQTFKELLQQPAFTTLFDCPGTYKLSFKPLLGITAPAIALEVGLRSQSDWQTAVQPLVQAIQLIIERGIL